MIDERLEQACFGRQGELQHHRRAGPGIERREQFLEQQAVGGIALGALDVHFGFDDRDEAMRRDALRFGELLIDDRLDPRRIGEIDDAAHLGAEHALRNRAFAQIVEARVRLHQLDAIGFVLKPLVHFKERHHAAFPQERRNRLAARFAVHRAFEQDRADHLLAIEAGCSDDAAAHVVDQAEHLFVVRKGVGFDAITLQCLGRRTAALVERGDKALPRFDLVEHFGIGGGHGISGCLHTYVAVPIAAPVARCNAGGSSTPSARRRPATACLPSIPGRHRRRSKRS